AAISSLILAQSHSVDLSMYLGVFLLGYAVFLFFNPSIHLKKNWSTIGLSGIITGFIAGIFGIVGAIRSSFLVSFNLDKKSFVGTSGMISFLINATRIITYLLGGMALSRQGLIWLPFLIGI